MKKLCHLLGYSIIYAVCESTFLRNVGSRTDYTAVYPRIDNIHNYRCENHKSYLMKEALHLDNGGRYFSETSVNIYEALHPR
jgi:hypothetical protein